MLDAAPALASPNRPAGAPAESYRPRQPQNTVLHRVVRDHFRTFLAHTARLYSRPLPRYVVQEWSASLRAADSREEARATPAPTGDAGGPLRGTTRRRVREVPCLR
jgi:hypothetical protein